MEKKKKAFNESKKRFTKKPVLVVPELDKKIRIKVDVSDYTMGDMLSMKCEDGKQTYLPKSLNETKSYKIHNK